ncbi:MAG: hypothetical protein ACRELG_29495 [Gemmataceae bacterium]
MRDLRFSQQVQEWWNEGYVEGQLETQRGDLLLVLKKCVCKGPVPNDLTEIIQARTDIGLLIRWFVAALDAKTLEDFRAAVQP